MSTAQILAAPWLITGLPHEAPIANGALALDARGRVLAVGPEAEVLRAHAGATLLRERAILLPGLVNAHAHLELSALRGHTPPGGGFGRWVTGMMQKRAVLRPEEDLEAIEAAVSELLRSGTMALGEVTNSLASLDALASAPIHVRLFHEVFGSGSQAAEAAYERARDASARHTFPAHVSYVRAPHTLFSLHPRVVTRIVAEAREAGALTSLHLAEHAAERAYLEHGGGPIAEFQASMGVPTPDWSPVGQGPVHYAEALSVLGPALLCVHLCDARPDELALVAQSGARAVLCPRSNLFIELKLPPLHAILAAGLAPALGTDSLASNTSLDVLAEAAALRDRFPQVPPSEIVAMATSYGADALGLGHRLGAFAPGRAPGVLAIDFAEVPPDPYKLVLRSPPLPRRVLVRAPVPNAGETLASAP
jgi:aminodeoxyfutalosine deaminase